MKKLAVLSLIIFSNLTYGQIPNKLSNEEKVYGLSKFWQEVNYNFVYLNKIDRTEWDSQYKHFIREVQNTQNDYEYYRSLQKFCTFLKDGHTNVWFPKEIQDNVLTTDFGDYKFELSNIEGKAIITRTNKGKVEELPIGTEITMVNGISTKQYIDLNVRPYISTSSPHILEDWSIAYLLEGYVGSTFELELKLPNGSSKFLKLTHNKSEDTVLYPEENKDLFEFKWMKDSVAYVALNSFSSWDIMKSFSDKLPEIRKAKKLIIDVRKNGGGDESIGREIIKYLTNDTILYRSKSQTRLTNSYYKAVGKYSEATDTLNNNLSKQAYLTYNDNYYYDFPYSPYSTKNLKITRIELPTAILIGHNTGSAAEDFLIYADNQENMTKIGEPTFGSTGQPMIIDLPGGGIGRVCTKKDTYPDGREFVGYGIKPNIFVKTTLQDYMENKDPVLETALQYLNEKDK